VRYLSLSIGPRLTGSPSCQRACEWARARFAELGLDARLERWGEMPVGFERGPSRGGMVAPVRIDYVFATNAWTPGTPGPVRAPARLYPRSPGELEAAPERWRGAWVVDLESDERPRARERRAIDARLAELGIAGRIHRAGDLVVTGGNPRVDPEDLPTLVRIRLQASYFDDLAARLYRAERETAARAEASVPADEEGEDGAEEAAGPAETLLEFDVDNRFLPGPFPVHNVVADLVGTEFPDQYVIVGGHIDSWDGAQGAQDNGTGVATTIEAARLLAETGARPRRTIRFVLWSGEEQGLLGSQAYVEAHADEMERVSAVLVHDGGTNYASGIAGPPALVEDLRRAFAPVVALDSAMPFAVEENEGLPRFGGSDHSSYVGAGVPGFFWEQTGRADYRYIHHTQHDVIDHVVPEYLQHTATVVAIGAYELAMLDGLLDRTGLVREGRGGRGRERRRMGVQLEDTEIVEVVEDGMADEAGWQAGDLILAVDGVEVATMREVVAELQKGGPRKTFQLLRGEETIESVLDYTGTPSELAREEAAAAAEAAGKAADGDAPAAGEPAKEPVPAGAGGGR
jgi:hypothetical protein